ncbi:retrovirus-related Pol polyprotein from transposon 17.6 [Trichonephila clavipes]|nr:retrovirus-related Pol polyprotein from transposon 17.6 [Trichonephila clavipes]
MEINGIDRVCLRDSGSSIDVCSRSWINEDDLLGEYVWLKSPLDEICHCLPLAKIKIKTKKGEFYTKAAIKQDSSDNDLYLLGNRTAELLESNEQGVHSVNAVVTRRFPREIQSDLGTSFTSELTTTFFNKFGIKVTRSSVSHPQSNAVERVHRTIKRVIKALCVESGEDWEGVLPLALFTLRTVAHESTGFSPTELVMGKNLRTPQTLVYEEWMEEGNTSQSVVEYILQLNNRLKRCQDIVITRMKECQLKRKTWYDRDVVERKFVEGDLVMVLVTSKQNKLEVNWIGPGKIPLTPRAQRYAAFVTPFGTYIPKKMMFGTIASPLTDVLKGKIKKEKITWDEKCGKALPEELKAKLVTLPILFAPDFATDFILQTDASECCMKGNTRNRCVMGQCVQLRTRNYGALDQTAREIPKGSELAHMVTNVAKIFAKLVANLVSKNDANLALPPRFRHVLIESPL